MAPSQTTGEGAKGIERPGGKEKKREKSWKMSVTKTDRAGQFHFRRAAFAQQFKSRVGLALAEAASLRITLNLDGTPIISQSHTHPSHSQTSRLLTSSLSLGVPVPMFNVNDERPSPLPKKRREKSWKLFFMF